VSIQGEKKAECFIESETGVCFQIAASVDPEHKWVDHNAWKALIDIDGQEMRKPLVYSTTRRIEGCLLDLKHLVPFEFGNTQFTGIS
jgi:hypothetical protein